MTAYEKRTYKGNVSYGITLANTISPTDTAIPVSDGSTLPDGSGGPYTITIDPGGTEEKCRITSRSGNTLTVGTRGYDNTTAATHVSGVKVVHTISAVDFDEANQLVHALLAGGTTGQVATVDTTLTPPIKLATPTWVVQGSQVFSVKDAVYGAKGDGATDDSAAIQSAITAANAAGGGIVWFPPGTYLTTSASLKLTTVNNVVLRGSGWGSSIVLPSGRTGGGTQYLLEWDAANSVGVAVEDLDLHVSYTSASWSVVLVGSGSVAELTFERCRFRADGYTGALPFMANMSPTAAGGLADIAFTRCRFENNTGAAVDGLLVRGFSGLAVEGCTFVNINNPLAPDNLLQKTNLRYVDNEEVYTSNTFDMEGPDLMGISGVVYTGNQQRSTVTQGNNDAGGVLIDTHTGLVTAGISMMANNFLCNPIQLAPQNGAAITDCVIEGNTVSASRTTSGVNSGIVLGTDAGTSARILIRDNTITGAFTGSPVNLGSGYTAGAVVLKDNAGYNHTLAPANVTVGASPFTYTNNDPVPEDVYITGGTVSRVDVFVAGNGAQVLSASNASVHLEPGEQTVVYYTAAPTMTKVRQ